MDNGTDVCNGQSVESVCIDGPIEPRRRNAGGMMSTPSTNGSSKSGLSLLWARLQLPCGLLFMVGVSFLLHMAFNPDALDTENFRFTIAAAAAAHGVGYFAYRRFDVFPGMTAVGAILPTFLLSYGAALLVVLLLRFEYSRAQLVISFLATVSWYLVLDLVGRRLRPYRLAIVPGGDADGLYGMPGVSWSILDAPLPTPPQVEGVVVDLRTDLSPAWERFIAHCALCGTPVYHVKQVLESLTGRVRIEHLSENTLGSLNPNQVFVGVKQAIDWVGALVLMVVLSPLLLLAAIAIRLDSPGPALFRQARMGYRGRIFRVYKFRTMRESPCLDDEDEKQRAMTRVADARITRIGTFLRRTRIDELPQILNILRGEMSWIGPRPEALPLSRWYEAELPFYHYRHIVRPGITGWAQVNQGHVTALNDALEKLHYDFYYIKNFSPWLDFIIVMRTLTIVVTGFGAR